MHDLFISYNHNDTDFANCLKDDIQNSGASVWIVAGNLNSPLFAVQGN